MRKTLIAQSVALTIAGLMATPALAESQTDEIIVTGEMISPDKNQLPISPISNNLDAADLEHLVPTTNDTASLLRNTPGVNLLGGGAVSSLPSIHGLADDRLRTKVDGMDLISACANHMNSPLSYIDPSNVGEVKAYTGIAPVSVGGDGIGGSIIVKSPDAEFANNEGEIIRKGNLGLSYRSNGGVFSGNISATAASNTFSITYQGATAEGNDYDAGGDFKAAGAAAAGRDWLNGDEVGSTMFKAINHSLKMALRKENHLLELKIGVQDIPYQGWVNQRMDMTDNDSTQINLNYIGDYDWGKLEARAYNEHTRHRMQFYDDKLYWYNGAGGVNDGIECTPSAGGGGCAAGMPMDTEGDNSGLSVKSDIDLNNRDRLLVGAEIQQYRLDDWWNPAGRGMWPNVFWNIRDGERDRYALFGEWDAKWSPQWQTQFGLRHETVEMDTGTVQGYNAANAQYAAESAAFNAADRSKTDHNLDLSLLAKYVPNETKKVEFGYARKTRSPNLYERYAWSTGGMAMRMVNWAGDGNGYVGNLDLKPEVSHTLSVTADWHDPNENSWGLKVTPYFTYVEDYIDARRCSSANANCNAANQAATNAFVYLQFVNQSARLYGIDISGFHPLGQSERFGKFTATGMVNYTSGENRDTGDNLYNIMPLNAKFAVNQKHGNWSNSIELVMVDDKTDVSSVRNEMTTDSYSLLNLRGSYKWKQARFDFGIENVLNELYDDPTGGAYMGQGKTMSANDVAWGTPVPGAGRSIYLGVNIDF